MTAARPATTSSPGRAPEPPPGFLRRNVIYLAAFLMDAAMSFGVLGAAYLARKRFGASQAGLGLLALVTAGVYMASCLSFGRLSDRWGRRRLIVAGSLLALASLVLAAVAAGSLGQLYMLMGSFSLGQGAFWPVLEADIADHSAPGELAGRLGRFNISWCLGFMVGWPLAGVVGQGTGQRTTILIGAALALAGLTAYLSGRFAPAPGPKAEPSGDAPGREIEVAAARRAARAVPFWRMALVLNFAAMGLSNTLRSQMPAVTGGAHSALGGLYGAVYFGLQVAAFATLAAWTGWHFRAMPLTLGALAAAGGALACGLSPRPAVFAAACALGGAGCGVIYYSSIYYSVAAASGRGHRGGIHEAVLAAGAALVPWTGGLLAEARLTAGRVAWKEGVPFLVSAAALAAAGLVAAGLYAGVRRRQAAEAALAVGKGACRTP